MDYFGYALIAVGLIIMIGCMFVYFSDIDEEDNDD